MKRAIFTVATGAPRYAEMALGLARSLSLVGDRTPRYVLSDHNDPRLARWFEAVLPPEDDGGLTFLRKLDGLRRTEADAVLFLDSDSIAFRCTDEIFRVCEGRKFAVQGEVRTQGHWYGELSKILPRYGLSGIQRFNGGLIYYERDPEVESLFEKARSLARAYDETGLERFRGQVPDEPCISLAMSLTGVGQLLPNELDLMNTPVGLIGRLEMSVRTGKCAFLKRGNRVMHHRPAILHAAKYVNNIAYWRELRELERICG